MVSFVFAMHTVLVSLAWLLCEGAVDLTSLQERNLLKTHELTN